MIKAEVELEIARQIQRTKCNQEDHKKEEIEISIYTKLIKLQTRESIELAEVKM